MDEVSLSSRTYVLELRDGEIRQFIMTPEDFGIAPAKLEALAGGDAADNAKIIESVLRGERGPRRDVVLLNAAPAIIAGGAAKTWKDGIRLAAESIDSGAAMRKIEELRQIS
jgi:anthranilate phosphoribosyltransferase